MHGVVFTDNNFQPHTGGQIKRHMPLQQPTSPIKHGDVPGGRHLSADLGIITFERGMFLVLLVVISTTPSEVSGISLIEKAQGEIVAMKSKDTIRNKLTFLLSISPPHSHTTAKLLIYSLTCRVSFCSWMHDRGCMQRLYYIAVWWFFRSTNW
jgi:hypothetical protein